MFKPDRMISSLYSLLGGFYLICRYVNSMAYFARVLEMPEADGQTGG